MAANDAGSVQQHATPDSISLDRSTSRRVLGTYPSYGEAQRVVDHLSDERFPVEHVSIVGEGLRYVERVTGRKGVGTAALQGAGSGALLGAILGFLFGIFSIVEPLTSGLILALWGLVFGAVLGAILGAVGHAMTGGRRDFSSVNTMEAERYEVVVEAQVASQAQELVDRMPAR